LEEQRKDSNIRMESGSEGVTQRLLGGGGEESRSKTDPRAARASWGEYYQLKRETRGPTHPTLSHYLRFISAVLRNVRWHMLACEYLRTYVCVRLFISSPSARKTLGTGLD
jgi:hypothetical protein